MLKEEECEAWWDGGDGKVEVTTFRGELRAASANAVGATPGVAVRLSSATGSRRFAPPVAEWPGSSSQQLHWSWNKLEDLLSSFTLE